jgi:L-aminoadipate-semialdehyde dehydrogenase
MLLQMRKQLKASVPIGTVYEHNTLRTFSAQVDQILRPTNGVNGETAAVEESPYAKSLDKLLMQLPKTYQTADPATIRARSKPTVLLTGATGFLGAYIIKDILERTSRSIRLVAHVRARDPKAGLDRLQRSLRAYGLWRQDWAQRLSAVVGDLAKPKLGLGDGTWTTLANEVDVVIHNGAQVHWVKRYQDMMASNVLSTLEAMKLCNEGKPKLFAFVSSTSVLDNDHYVNLSDQQISTGQFAITEADDMMGSKSGLTTG